MSLPEIKECKNENPDQVDEVPVQPGVLDVLGVGFFEPRRQSLLDREEEDDQADDDVDRMEASHGEVARGKQVAVRDVVLGVGVVGVLLFLLPLRIDEVHPYAGLDLFSESLVFGQVEHPSRKT